MESGLKGIIQTLFICKTQNKHTRQCQLKRGNEELARKELAAIFNTWLVSVHYCSYKECRLGVSLGDNLGWQFLELGEISLPPAEAMDDVKLFSNTFQPHPQTRQGDSQRGIPPRGQGWNQSDIVLELGHDVPLDTMVEFGPEGQLLFVKCLPIFTVGEEIIHFWLNFLQNLHQYRGERGLVKIEQQGRQWRK